MCKVEDSLAIFVVPHYVHQMYVALESLHMNVYKGIETQIVYMGI